MGTSKYRYHKNKYGMKRVNRIVKNMDKKSMSYKQALTKEQMRLAKVRATKAIAIAGGLTLGWMDIATKGELHRTISQSTNQLISSGKNFINKHAKSMILDSNGNVIKYYYLKSLGTIIK